MVAGALTSGGESPLRACGIHKQFGAVKALCGVDIAVDRGEVVALLGPNGAGKSTLIRVLATAVLPDAGEVRIGGVDALARPRAARTLLGVVLGDERSFFWRLSGRANLQFFAALHGMRRREADAASRRALETVGLADVGDRRVDRYSTGMRARLGIARGLLGQPDVLLLDEPTRSVDPLSTITVRGVISDLAQRQGVAVLVTTHDLHEAAAVADRIVVLVRGTVARVLPRGSDSAGLEAVLVEAVARAGEPAYVPGGSSDLVDDR